MSTASAGRLTVVRSQGPGVGTLTSQAPAPATTTVRAALAGRGYKLQHLNLAAGYNAPQPRFAMALRAGSAQELAAPSLEAGVSMGTVTASGTIEILE